MSQVNLKPEVLLQAINANLNQQFFEENRDHSKSQFNALTNGNRLPFMKFDMGEKGEVLCELELDISEHVGKLNFGKFRRSLAMMMIGIHHRIEAKENLNPMRSDTGELMFNVPGILKSEDAVNILVCSFRQLAPGLSAVRLMYLDPAAYSEAAGVDLSKLERNDQDPEELPK